MFNMTEFSKSLCINSPKSIQIQYNFNLFFKNFNRIYIRVLEILKLKLQFDMVFMNNSFPKSCFNYAVFIDSRHSFSYKTLICINFVPNKKYLR